jgi:hypothetical protein
MFVFGKMPLLNGKAGTNVRLRWVQSLMLHSQPPFSLYSH